MTVEMVVVEKQLVVFNLGEEAYAIDIGIVREIIRMQPITRVPGTAIVIEGVINLRGSVIPVVDLRKRFNLHIQNQSKDIRIVVVNTKGQDVGIIVDSVDEVLRIPVDSIGSAAGLFDSGHIEHLSGIVKLNNRLIILLDMEGVLYHHGNSISSDSQLKNKENAVV